MIPGHASLEQACRLKALGYDQNRWPQMVYEKGCPRIGGHIGLRCCCFTVSCDGFRLGTQKDWDYRPAYCHREPLHLEWLAAPVLISGDPAKPGVVEWMSKRFDWRIAVTESALYTARPSRESEPVVADTLPALIDLVLTEIE